MSKENIIQNQTITTQEDKESLSKKSKVDINILLNKVRANQKKEKFESLIFVALICSVVIVSGLIISL
tara:strand:+ start:905 stop:1108 length:204 start_codon:yes stop_codon:yes gene_type:complete